VEGRGVDVSEPGHRQEIIIVRGGPVLLAAAFFWLAPGLGAAEDPRPAAAFRFREAAAELGVTGPLDLAGRPGKDHLLDSAGTGLALLDFDRDGRLDIYIVNGFLLAGDQVVERGRNALWRQREDGTFEDATDRAGVDGKGRWGSGAAAADFDGDGWTDILVTNFGPNLLYRNLGDGRFEDVAAQVGLECPGWNTGAAFFDADGDGRLDVYIAGYIDCSLGDVLRARRTLDWKQRAKVAAGPFGLKGAPDHFFHQEGGRFVDRTREAGLEDRVLGFGFAVRAADFDDDGDADLLVANDSEANYYYRNEGHGRFKELGVIAGCALNSSGASQANMGIAVGDIDGDGILDIICTTFAEDSLALYRGLGGGNFADSTKEWDLQGPTYRPMKWGCVLGDFDCDGDLDLALACGHIYPQVDEHPEVGQTYAQTLLLLENRGTVFRDVTAAAGPDLAVRRSHRGLVAGDIDNDGDLDLIGTALDQRPFILRNEGPQGAWLTVVLEDERGPISLVGARVTVTAGGRRQIRDVAAGDSFLSTNDPRPHFGLGAAERADRVEVRWPDGSRTVLNDVPARKFLRVRAPTRAAAQSPGSRPREG
jgi:enediyne biosynthesis protein E4